MKKRVLFFTNILEKEALKNYLNDQVKLGWILTQVNTYTLTFEKTNEKNVRYEIGIFEYLSSENKVYRELAETFGFEYMGSRRDLVIFKSTSDLPFYSDELVDEEFNQKRIKSHMRHRIFEIMIVLVLLFQHIHLLGSMDFISDVSLYMIIYVVTLLMICISGGNGLISYVKYRHNGQLKTSYQGLEQRSWFYLLMLVVGSLQVFGFLLTGLKNENVMFLPLCLFSGLFSFGIGIFFYKMRDHWVKTVEMCLVSVMAFIGVFCFVLGLNQKPIRMTVERVGGAKQKQFVDSYEIPYSFCEDEACELIENDVMQSVMMKKQRVEEKLGEKSYSYLYYQLKTDFLSKRVMDQIVEYHNVELDQTFDDFRYHYQIIEANGCSLFVQKNHREAYKIELNESLSQEEVKNVIQHLSWKF